MSSYNSKEELLSHGRKEDNENVKSVLSLIMRILMYILVLFLAIFFCWYFVFISTHNFYAVYGPSMMSTLNSEITQQQVNNGTSKNISYDAIYVNKSAQLQLFDIIVIEREDDDSIVKRLMAQEGDWITIAKGDDGYLYFFRIPSGTDLSTFTDDDALVLENGENGYSIYSYSDWVMLREEITKSINGNSQTYEKNFYNTFLSDYFSTGENNSLSEDMEYNYYVSSNGLVYVQVPEGKFFYMGDNRGHSTDARENGFGDVDDIVGCADIIVYDYNFGNRLWEVVKFYFKEIENFFAR